MAATTDQVIALGNDGTFRNRIRTLMLQQAAVVYAESGATTGHAARNTLALSLLNNPSHADQYASVIATRTNLVASTVTYDFASGTVKTDATDASILSQLATDWSMLAGV